MSKCKAVLDGEKITDIRVRTKPAESDSPDEPEPKGSDESSQSSAATQQSE